MENQPATVTVAVKQGLLRGRIENLSENLGGRRYYSFKGIPFAHPPTGELRFKAPIAPKSWKGVRDAFTFSPISVQQNKLMGNLNIVGEEDCLYLNVYVPEQERLEHFQTLPVMVHIHGGGFETGSGDSELAGPEYFMMKGNVIIVSINYRVGPLGFMSLGTDKIPGNAGLKDQVFALKWVQENILRFRGDPDNVTIFGCSAGGASVHYLLLSPLAKGLFHRAISQSGVALNSWAYLDKKEIKQRSIRLAQVLGCKSEDPDVVADFLQKVPADILTEKKDEADKESVDLTYTDLAVCSATHYNSCLEDRKKFIFVPKCLKILYESAYIWAMHFNKKSGLIFNLAFVPTTESPSENAFLTEDPRKLLKSGNFNKVPAIFGATEQEGLVISFFIEDTDEFLSKVDKNICTMLPKAMNDSLDKLSGKKKQEIVNKIRKFYFNDKPVSKQTYGHLIDLISDTLFICQIKEVVNNYVQVVPDCPIYLYLFSYEGGLSPTKQMIAKGGKLTVEGTCHGDDIGYLFKISFCPEALKTSTDFSVILRMLDIWTDFATNSNPSENINIDWKPYKSGSFLKITSSLDLEEDFFNERTAFWNDIYKELTPKSKTKQSFMFWRE